jgi:hypothetical protein
MYGTFLLLHSSVRYIVLILLLALIVKSFMGWRNKSEFKAGDNKLSLFTLIATHTQFLLGLILYLFASPFVRFNSDTMKNRDLRYWTVEHITMMLIAVVLITVGRSTMKKLPDGPSKHKRLFIFNIIALILILFGIWSARRGFFSLPL